MTPRERVLATLEFANPDRAPRDLWALPWVSFDRPDDLKALLAKYPTDFMGVSVLGKADKAVGEFGRMPGCTDEWGCRFELAEDGVVGEVKHPPLADWSALAKLKPPMEMIQRGGVDKANQACQENLAGAKKWVNCGATLRPFERIQFLRGSENLYLDLGYETAELRKLLEMVHDFYLRELELVLKSDCDGVVYMDDWGSQQALLISPAQWRSIFKPLYKQYNDMIHKAGKKVFFHSDGHIAAIYPDLIEIGVDAQNSQLFCMDMEELGRKYRGKITFWGEIDRQHVMPTNDVPTVQAAVRRVRKALDDGRGGVIAQCEWGKNVNREAVEAVYATWDEGRT